MPRVRFSPFTGQTTKAVPFSLRQSLAVLVLGARKTRALSLEKGNYVGDVFESQSRSCSRSARVRQAPNLCGWRLVKDGSKLQFTSQDLTGAIRNRQRSAGGV